MRLFENIRKCMKSASSSGLVASGLSSFNMSICLQHIPQLAGNKVQNRTYENNCRPLWTLSKLNKEYKQLQLGTSDKQPLEQQKTSTARLKPSSNYFFWSSINLKLIVCSQHSNKILPNEFLNLLIRCWSVYKSTRSDCQSNLLFVELVANIRSFVFANFEKRFFLLQLT